MSEQWSFSVCGGVSARSIPMLDFSTTPLYERMSRSERRTDGSYTFGCAAPCSHPRIKQSTRSLENISASTEFLRTTPLSMRMPRNDFADVVIVQRKVQAGARFQLPNLLPVKLLPGRVVVNLERPKISSAFCDFGIAQ